MVALKQIYAVKSNHEARHTHPCHTSLNAITSYQGQGWNLYGPTTNIVGQYGGALRLKLVSAPTR
jgi:hypothetical protein